jgi:hypothetical protein
MAEQLMYLPVAPYTGPEDVCPECRGDRVTGTRYRWAGDGPTLLVDEVCPACGGCGRADHATCGRLDHAERESAWDADWDGEDDEEDGGAGQVCPSCQGQRWWPCQGFDQDTVTYLRMPCGCAEALMVPAHT